MGDVEVDIICPKPTQTFVDFIHDAVTAKIAVYLTP